jgi:hypothetical protein
LGSERKIDDIARHVEDIKSLLQSQSTLAPEGPNRTESTRGPVQSVDEYRAKSVQVVFASSEPRWNYSAHILDFVKAVVGDASLSSTNSASSLVIESLKGLIKVLDGPSSNQIQPTFERTALEHACNLPMVPVEQVIEILRWAKSA